MQKRSRKKKRPDINELAKTIVGKATSKEDDSTNNEKPEEETDQVDDRKNPAAVALGRLDVLKGGKARAKKLTKKQRSEAARKAALARWEKAKREGGITPQTLLAIRLDLVPVPSRRIL